MFLPTKLDEGPIQNRFFTDFPPTLHRLWYGGRAKEERTYSGTTREGYRIITDIISSHRLWAIKVKIKSNNNNRYQKTETQYA